MKKQRAVRGVVLLITISFVLILGIGAVAIARLHSTQIGMVRRQNNSTRAFYTAEAGLEKGINWLKAQSSPPSGTGQLYQSTGNSLGSGEYAFTVSANSANPGLTLKRYNIVSTGTIRGISRILTEEVRVENFARYSYFSCFESYLIWNVWFTTGSFLEGPVHTNDRYHISGDPIFDGPVSSVAATIDYMNGGPPNDNPEFRQGIVLGAAMVDADCLNAGKLRNASTSSGGYRFNGDTTVVLLSNGTMDVTNSSLTPPTQNMSLPGNEALFVDGGDLSISGTLNGKLTAGASKDIIIMNDIRYHTDPRTTPASTDGLGLIAERDVVVDYHAPDGNPGGNLEICASIIALGKGPSPNPYGEDDGSFYVESWWSGIKGILTIYGGLIQKNRGPVGTFYSSNNQKASGYDKDYHYDIRMVEFPPGYFPTTGGYERISWKEGA